MTADLLVAKQAAERIVAAHNDLAAAKGETHPSFQAAVLAFAYHELHASARGALIVARAFLAMPEVQAAHWVPVAAGWRK